MAEEEMMEDEPMTFDRTTLEGIFQENAAAPCRDCSQCSPKEIESGEFGVGSDNVILRGPAGFEIDMNACAPRIGPTRTGITAESQIRIGHTTAAVRQRSPHTVQHRVLAGRTIFDWVNENDPVMVGGSPRDLTFLIVRDDGYQWPTLTIDFVNELIESENVFSILTLGSPNTLRRLRSS